MELYLHNMYYKIIGNLLDKYLPNHQVKQPERHNVFWKEARKQ